MFATAVLLPGMLYLLAPRPYLDDEVLMLALLTPRQTRLSNLNAQQIHVRNLKSAHQLRRLAGCLMVRRWAPEEVMHRRAILA